VSEPQADAAERLLFTDRDGSPAQLEDVIDDGLDGVYEDRVDGLVEVMGSGQPYHRLLACQALTSWGDARGFEQLIQWADDPDGAPWADRPVTFDRVYGADSAFETLANALWASFRSEPGVSIRPLQVRAARALLGVVHERYVGRWLALAIVRDTEVEAAVSPQVRDAVQAALEGVRAGRQVGFDLAFQVASLLLALARVDDAGTAAFAGELIAVGGTSDRMAKELADSLGRGTGPATLDALDRLAASRGAVVSADVAAARTRRTR
jgi:hypothetical protein